MFVPIFAIPSDNEVVGLMVTMMAAGPKSFRIFAMSFFGGVAVSQDFHSLDYPTSGRDLLERFDWLQTQENENKLATFLVLNDCVMAKRGLEPSLAKVAFRGRSLIYWRGAPRR